MHLALIQIIVCVWLCVATFDTVRLENGTTLFESTEAHSRAKECRRSVNYCQTPVP